MPDELEMGSLEQNQSWKEIPVVKAPTGRAVAQRIAIVRAPDWVNLLCGVCILFWHALLLC